MSSWDDLALELRREAEEIFRATGEVIVVASQDDDETKLILVSRAHSVKISCVVDKNVIRWETDREYGFERITDSPSPVAKMLIHKVHR